MDEFVSLLKTLKKNDKIAQNVLLMISESFRYNEEAVGDVLVKQHKGMLSKEPVLDFLFLLCTRDARYLNVFKRHKREFGTDHRISRLLSGEETEETSKRVRVDDRPGDGEMCKGEGDKKDLVVEQQPGRAARHGEGAGRRASKDVLEEAMSRNEAEKRECDKGVLSNESIRVATSPSILYLPNQCKLCGLRYGNTKEGDEQMGIHIDEHRRRARVLGEKDYVSRELFPTLEAWTKNIEKIKLKLEVEKVEKIAHSGGPAFCDVCRNKIEVEWDDKEDSWMLKDAVSLEKAGSTSFCHRRCVS